MNPLNMPNGKILSLAALLIAFALVYHYVLEPVYTSYQLNSCLQRVDDSFRNLEEDTCVAAKVNNTNDCLWAAQRQIYCADSSHLTKNQFDSILGGSVSYSCQNVPDNSNGYWNGNADYQKLASECLQKEGAISCDYSQSPVDPTDVTADSNYCFKRY